MGLDPRRQGVSWEVSASHKKQKGGDRKKAADRYFSAVNRKLLSSETPTPTLPKAPVCDDAISLTPFILLGADDEKKGGETGKRSCRLNNIKK